MKKTLILVALLVAFAPICHAQDADSGSTKRAEPVSFMSDSSAPDEFSGDEGLVQAKHPFKPRPMSLKDGKIPAELLTKYDTDGDGVLSETEKAAMDTAMKAEMLAKFDTDGDGTLSDTEKTAMHEARKAEMQAKMLTKFDADGDGTLSDTEKATMLSERPGKGQGVGRDSRNGPPNGGGKVPADLLTKYDADGDGALSDTEKATMDKAREADMLAKFDTDGDGVLSASEKEAVRQTRPERGGKDRFRGKHKGLKNTGTGNKSSGSSESTESTDSE